MPVIQFVGGPVSVIIVKCLEETLRYEEVVRRASRLMAEGGNIRTRVWLLLKLVAISLVVTLPSATLAQLSSTFYDSSCPNLQSTIQSAFQSQLSQDFRVGASITRLHFHDCFVQGCDASVLLVDTANFTGEQSAAPNANSLRGFSAVNAIKSAVESVCPNTVSCADILALTARDAVVAAGGPSWTVEFGRLDSTTASLTLANQNLPSPNSDAQVVTQAFAAQGLSQLDMVTLSGAHTFGMTRCVTINPRLYNWQNTGAPDPSLNTSYLATLQGDCPNGGPGSTTVFIDQATGTVFDNDYYTNLLSNKGTFFSDQSLQDSGGATQADVGNFASSQTQFFSQFTISIVKMGQISSGNSGEIRVNCSVVNQT